MNVLTKVFVVLMTILSVVLVSLVVPFVANTENYKDQVKAAESRANAAEATAAVAQQRADASRSELVSQFDDAKKVEAALRGSNDSLKGELATTRGDLERTRADLVRTQADIANLTSANDQFAKIQVDLQKELAMRREETTKQAKQIIELEGANNDQSSATATLRRQVRLAQENLVKTQEELTEANRVLSLFPPDVLSQYTKPSASASADTGVVANPPINAQVSDVKQAGEVSLVQLNVGSSGGVKDRMVFQVHRDGNYVGTVIVMTVDEQASVARVKLLKTGGAIKAGDFVRSGAVN